jgi:regulator of sirC expression with transglutaminase-like and TPR domain
MKSFGWVIAPVVFLIVGQLAVADESRTESSSNELPRLEISQVPVSADSLTETLVRRERELAEARTEIARLLEQVKALESSNRREKIALHYNLGCVFKAAQHFERAESEFLKVLILDSDDPAVHYNLGILYEDDLKKPSKAREHYTRFLELAPEDRDAPKVREWLARLKP